MLDNGIYECDVNHDKSESSDVELLPSLELPMSNFWDIYVTYIEDLNKIHFRLIGDKYNVSMAWFLFLDI